MSLIGIVLIVVGIYLALKVAGRSTPTAINTWSGEDPVTARIGPDTWLFHSAYHEASELLTAIRAGCGRRSYAVTEISDSFVTITVDGAQSPAEHAVQLVMDAAMDAAEIAEPSVRRAVRVADDVRQRVAGAARRGGSDRIARPSETFVTDQA